MGINDKKMARIVPNLLTMERKYESMIRFFADELEQIEGFHDSHETYNRGEIFRLAVSNANQLKRRFFSDIADIRQIYLSSMNERKLEERIEENRLRAPQNPENLLEELQLPHVHVDSIDINLPRHGGFPDEGTFHTEEYDIRYNNTNNQYNTNPEPKCEKTNTHHQGILHRPKYTPGGTIPRPRINDQHNPPIVAVDFPRRTNDPTDEWSQLAATPANLYYEAGMLLKLLVPTTEAILKHYQNIPPVIRYEKQLVSAVQLTNDGLLNSPAYRRFVKIRNILKEKYQPSLG